MHRKSTNFSLVREYFSLLTDQFKLVIDQTLEFVYTFVEVPLQNAGYHFGIHSLYESRRGWLWQSTRNISGLLSQSYLWAFFIYFLILFFAPLYSRAVQRCYFADSLLSTNRQCLDIQFVRIYHRDNSLPKPSRLNDNFIEENRIIKEEFPRNNLDNYTEFYELFDLLNNYHWMICERSLYLHARFQTYSSLLHSDHSQYRFHLSKYPRTFAIDQPPFIDLCLHAFNRTHSEHLQSRLRSLSSYSYSSINLFVFDFHFTQVTVTLYELNHESKHLERISIHTGWLRDLYAQFHFFKYQDALSTVLFDGYALGEQSVDYFNYTHIPVPADSILALNEMVQQALLILPIC